MNWNYSGNPAFSPLDATRFLITDTLAERPLVSDEEIVYALSTRSSDPTLAAAFLLEVLIRRYSMVGRVQIGRYMIDTRHLIDALQKASASIIASARAAGVAWAGGLSASEKSTDANDE